MKNVPKWCHFHLKVFLQSPWDMMGGEWDHRSPRDAGTLTDCLCWFSWAGWFYEDVSFLGCASAEAEGHKKHVPVIFSPFNCRISDKSCGLSCCETCNSAAARTSASSPAAAAVFFPPSSLRSFFFFSASQRHRCRVDWTPTLLYIN